MMMLGTGALGVLVANTDVSSPLALRLPPFLAADRTAKPMP